MFFQLSWLLHILWNDMLQRRALLTVLSRSLGDAKLFQDEFLKFESKLDCLLDSF